MKVAIAMTALAVTLALPAKATLLQGTSADPLGELNALYGKICQWTEGEMIPVEVIDFSHDGVDDYVLSYDVACRGQVNAFAGTAGLARQIWMSLEDGTYLRILDVNSRDLRIETREGHTFVILQHQGSYCMTADAAPCFLTLEFKENQLVWAEARHQHTSMDARMRLLESEQKETEND